MLPVVSAVQDRLGRELRERGAIGRARIGGRVLVAARARLLEHGGTVGRLRAGGAPQHAERDDGGNDNGDWSHECP